MLTSKNKTNISPLPVHLPLGGEIYLYDTITTDWEDDGYSWQLQSTESSGEEELIITKTCYWIKREEKIDSGFRRMVFELNNVANGYVLVQYVGENDRAILPNSIKYIFIATEEDEEVSKYI